MGYMERIKLIYLFPIWLLCFSLEFMLDMTIEGLEWIKSPFCKGEKHFDERVKNTYWNGKRIYKRIN